MSQDTEQVVRAPQQERPSAETELRRKTRQQQALSPLAHWLIPVITVVDLLFMSVVALNGWTFVFQFMYIGVLLTYVFGGLYLMKKLIDHREQLGFGG